MGVGGGGLVGRDGRRLASACATLETPLVTHPPTHPPTHLPKRPPTHPNPPAHPPTHPCSKYQWVLALDGDVLAANTSRPLDEFLAQPQDLLFQLR